MASQDLSGFLFSFTASAPSSLKASVPGEAGMQEPGPPLLQVEPHMHEQMGSIPPPVMPSRACHRAEEPPAHSPHICHTRPTAHPLYRQHISTVEQCPDHTAPPTLPSLHARPPSSSVTIPMLSQVMPLPAPLPSDTSPKRKRAISDPSTPIIPFAPQLGFDPTPVRTPSPAASASTLLHSEHRSKSTPDSPRTLVAHKFESLQIRPAFVFGAKGVARQEKKRARGAELINDSKLASLAATGQNISDVEIPETPQLPPRPSSSPLEQSKKDIQTPQPDWRASPRPKNAKLMFRRVASPARNSAEARTSESEASQQASAPSAVDLSDLVWHDYEITGHLVDPMTDPEDDGYGINGIGFRPTPAIAWYRSQKRRQQIVEWRAREAREARQQRARSRARGKEARGGIAKDVRRVVRFA